MTDVTISLAISFDTGAHRTVLTLSNPSVLDVWLLPCWIVKNISHFQKFVNTIFSLF